MEAEGLRAEIRAAEARADQAATASAEMVCSRTAHPQRRHAPPPSPRLPLSASFLPSVWWQFRTSQRRQAEMEGALAELGEELASAHRRAAADVLAGGTAGPGSAGSAAGSSAAAVAASDRASLLVAAAEARRAAERAEAAVRAERARADAAGAEMALLSQVRSAPT